MELKILGNNQTVVSFSYDFELFYSYETPVAGFRAGLGYFKVDRYYSVTTGKHVNRYLGGISPKVIGEEELRNMIDLFSVRYQ